MTPAQQQYGEFQANLPHTGLNLGVIAVLSVLFIAIGLLIYFYDRIPD